MSQVYSKRNYWNVSREHAGINYLEYEKSRMNTFLQFVSSENSGRERNKTEK